MLGVNPINIIDISIILIVDNIDYYAYSGYSILNANPEYHQKLNARRQSI